MNKVIGLMLVVMMLFSFQGIARSEVMVDLSWVDTLEEELEPGAIAGLGVVYAESPYAGVSSDPMVVPVIIAEYKQFFIDTMTAGYYFNPPTEELRFGIIGAIRPGGYSYDDGRDLGGMQQKDAGFDAGVRMNWKNDIATLNIDALTDVSGTSEGQVVKATVSKVLFEGFLTPRVGVVWQSEDSLDYYYGVNANETAAGRAEYSPSSDLDYMIGVSMGVPLGEKWAIIGDVQATFLGDDTEDSPIVEESTLMRYTLGMVYRF